MPPQALEKGARHAVVDDAALAATDPARYTYAPDPLLALQALARHHRQQFRIPVLAITGSNGKTTTKELLTAVLAQQFRVLATIGNLNNHIGVPLTLLRLRAGEHDFAVIEMGANHRGEIAAYCEWAAAHPRPHHQHRQGPPRRLWRGRGRGPGQGRAVRLPGPHRRHGLRQHPRCRACPAWPRRCPPASPTPARPIPTPPPCSAADPAVALRLADGTDVAAQLTGDYNFPNLAAAAAVGQHFGVPADKIAAALAHYNPQNNRSQLVRTAARQRAGAGRLQRQPQQHGRGPAQLCGPPHGAPARAKLVILGDMFELGDESAAEHRALGQLLAELPLPAGAAHRPGNGAGGRRWPAAPALRHQSRSRRVAAPTPRARPAGAGERQPRHGPGNAGGAVVAW